MSVMISLGSDSRIMSDGDWNGSPDNYFSSTEQNEDVTIDVEDEISFDLSGYDLGEVAGGGSVDIELEILGDHNNPSGEWLNVETTYGIYNESSRFLVDESDDDYDPDFWEGDLGPTTTGAQPNQGRLFVVLEDGTEVQSVLPAGTGDGSNDFFTAQVVDEIIEEKAILISKDAESNTVTGSLDLDPTADELRFELTIPKEDSEEDGVDVSQTTATISLSVDFDSEKDISNMVFYFSSGDLEDGCLKLKIDGFDEYWEKLNVGYDSTSTMDMMIDEETLEALFDGFCQDLADDYDLDKDGEWEDDWTFSGFSTKAGNNFDLDYAASPKEARGEGEYIGDGSLADSCYGAEGAVACEIDAAFYNDYTMMWESNVDILFS